MCGIGLLIEGNNAENGQGNGEVDVIARLHSSWTIDPSSSSSASPGSTDAGNSSESTSSAVTVSSFFPSKISNFTKNELRETLRRRGPDQQGCREFENASGTVSLFGAVLHLRGDKLANQPVDLPDSSAIAYNGEVFGLRNKSTFMENVLKNPSIASSSSATLKDALEKFATSRFPESDSESTEPVSWLESNEISDTTFLAESITELEQISDGNGDLFDILLKCLMEQLCGPFALLHYCPRRKRVFGMRDVLGRRSLCLNVNPNGDLCVANVALGDTAVELHCTGAWVIQLDKKIRFIPRTLPDPFVSDDSFISWRSESEKSATVFQTLFNDSLRKAVQKRVAHQDSVGLLFSGGLDSAVLAVLAAQEMLGSKKPSEKKSLQLINVSFDPAVAPDRHTCLLSYRDILKKLNAETKATTLSSHLHSKETNVSLDIELVLIDENYNTVAGDGNQAQDTDTTEETAKKRILSLLGPNNTHMDFNICACLWRGSAGAKEVDDNSANPEDRTHFLVTPESLGVEGFNKLVDTAYVADFKRGGDDIKLHKRLERLQRDYGSAEGNDFCIPGFKNDLLEKLFPNQVTGGEDSSTVDTQVPDTDQKKSGKTPASTLEESPRDEASKIDASLYRNGENKETKSSTSSAGGFKVLLLGHGADELLGGYGRHISAFEQRGITGLQQELLIDCRRLWTRNLGRDDRVVSDWSREARHPFLDEDFIKTVVGRIPCLPDKLWLRNFASAELGLEKTAAKYEKRAIQFGTRIAKQSNKDKFESNRKAKGQQKYV